MFRVLFLFFLLFSIPVLAQTGKPIIQHFTTENGLPSQYVYSVIQDRDGYIWMATENGVVKCNGYSFKVFNMGHGLPSNDVWKLFADSRGRVWIHSHSYEFGFIKNDKYVSVKLPPKDRMPIVNYITEQDGVVYFGYIYDMKTMMGAVMPNDSVFTYSFGELIYKTGFYQKYFYGLRKKSGALVRFSIVNGFLKEQYVCNFKAIPLTDKYAFLSNGKLEAYNLLSNDVEVHDLNGCQKSRFSLKDYGGKQDELIVLIEDGGKGQQSIYSNKAIYSLDSNLKLGQRIDFSTVADTFSQITWQFSDSFENTWYSTYADGVWFRNKTANVFFREKSLDAIRRLKYVGSSKGGHTYWWDKRKMEVLYLDSTLTIKERTTHKENVIKVTDMPGKGLFYLTSNGVYSQTVKNERDPFPGNKTVHAKLGKFSKYNGGRLDSELDSLNYLCYNIFAHNNAYWLSTVYGVKKIEFSGKKPLLYHYNNDRNPEMLYDTSNNLFWLYNRENIVVVNPITEQIVSFEQQMLGFFKAKAYQSIQADKHGNIYILTNNRLFVYNNKRRRIISLKPNFSLDNSSLKIYGDKIIVLGKFGISYSNIWGELSFSKFKIAGNPNSFYYNTIKDAVISDIGILLMNTDKGFYRVSLPNFFSDASLFRGTDNDFFSLQRKDVQQRIKQGDTIYVEPAARKIELDAINFYGKGTPSYTYSINGSDNWIESNSGEIFFLDLKPDVFYEIRCAISDENWQSPVFTFRMYIMPHWWQTRTWCRIFWGVGIIGFIIVVLAVILATRYFVARSNQKKQQLVDLELRAIHAQINPHFIFNTLGTALFFINKNKLEEAYQHVSKFSKLLRSYLKSSQERYVTLAEEIEMLRNYIELQQMRFEEKIDYSIVIENKIPANSLRIPSLLLQPLVENAINHGLFHLQKGTKGRLLLQFLQGESSNDLICVIDDNGVGRGRAREIKNNSSVRYDSYGTQLTSELIDIFKRYEDMNIFLDYTDKPEPENGTLVRLVIKNVKFIA